MQAQEQILQQEQQVNIWEPELLKEDENLKGGHLRPNRSRSDQYKMRSSVVQNLHRDREQSYQQKSSQRGQASKHKLHLPRMKVKPRMDVYIPTTVTVGTLARILDVKFSALFSPLIKFWLSLYNLQAA